MTVLSKEVAAVLVRQILVEAVLLWINFFVLKMDNRWYLIINIEIQIKYLAVQNKVVGILSAVD